jgi:hypothetical protein
MNTRNVSIKNNNPMSTLGTAYNVSIESADGDGLNEFGKPISLNNDARTI